MDQMPRDSAISRQRPIKFLVFIVGVISIAIFQTYLFQVEISKTPSINQSDFLIDAFYYVHLGEDISRNFTGGLSGFLSEIYQRAPTSTSSGVIFVNAIYGLLFDSVYIKVAIHSTLFAAIIYCLLPNRQKGRSLFFIFLFGGLLSYIFLPSKESLLLIAFALMLSGLSKDSLSLFFLALLTFVIARPEALIFLVAGGVLIRCMTVIRALICGICIAAIYFLLDVRSLLFEVAVFQQSMALTYSPSFQCSIAGFNVCFSEVAGFEKVMVTRLFVALALPIKWFYDLFAYFIIGDIVPYELFIKLAQALPFIFLVVKWRVFFIFIRHPRFRFFFLFAFLYVAGYLGIVFSQPSRPLSTALTLALLAYFFIKFDDRNLGGNRY